MRGAPFSDTLRPSMTVKAERIVVVGGGISGLSTAIFLAGLGRRVTLVEQHHLLGGYLQSFTRNGVRFEGGFHHLGSSLPGEIFARYLKLLGVYEDYVLLPHREDALFRLVLPNGRRLDIPRGKQRIAEVMKRISPRDAAGIDRLMARIWSHVEKNPWVGLRSEKTDWDTYQEFMTVSLRDVVNEHLASEDLRKMLDAVAFNTTLKPEVCPFGTFALKFYLLMTSLSRIQGGGEALIGAMERRLRALGGEILLGRGAERLRVEGAYARALELSDGTTLDFDLLISTCHPTETVRFCGPEHFRHAFLENLASMGHTPGSFKVYLELDRKAESLEGDPWLILEDHPSWPQGLYVASPSNMDPAYGDRHTVEILLWQEFREVEAWKDSTLGRRPPEYLRFKEKLAGAAIDRVERDFPGIRDAIRQCHTATPLTNLHYTRSDRGSAMGISQDIHHQGRRHLRPRNRLRNVLLAGQSLGTPGIIGCVIFSALLCNSIAPEFNVLKRLREVTF